ncbi:MAG: (Fe-S)-binding protein [Anaerolineales bacterium]|nr:(Fe-S)-binding protein [Anaerolineales bacterium]
MLSVPEKIAFILLVAAFGALTAWGFYNLFRAVRRGRPAGPLGPGLLPRAARALLAVGLQLPLYKARPILTTFHALIFFGFSYYFLVNVNDLLEGFWPGYATATTSGGLIGPLNLLGDLLSMAVLLGVLVFLVRRFVTGDQRLTVRSDVRLLPPVQHGGIKRDSLVVGGFILMHVGSRFLGQSLRLAEAGVFNPMQPFASLVALPLQGVAPAALSAGIHVTWWLAIGLIVVFLPYFVISKHLHIMAAPLNLALARPAPRGRLDPAVPVGAPAEAVPGAATLADLPWPRLLDAYACIMCNRCQDVCPAYNSQRPLSPSALEINKRYWLNGNLRAFAGGAASPALLDFAISPEAAWACTTCYACVRVCPVGNAPMADIVDLRRRMVNDGAELDPGLQSTLEKLGKTGNSFGQAARGRGKWAAKLDFKVKDIRKEPAEFLWFVGDYAAFDARVQDITRTVARVLHAAGVDFGILYDAERNSGNDVRRVGEEGLFEQLAEHNIAAMQKCAFQRVITTDPHSLNALQNEYPDHGGRWDTLHYTRLLAQLLDTGRLTLERRLNYRVTFHDPCYLGRYNQGFSPPRALIQATGCELVEMPRNRANSYCCGAGGGQIWMGATPPGERPAENRIREALAALNSGRPDGAAPARPLLFVVACPKDVVMYTDAVKTTGCEGQIDVRDVIQLVAEAMPGGVAQPAAADPVA